MGPSDAATDELCLLPNEDYLGGRFTLSAHRISSTSRQTLAAPGPLCPSSPFKELPALSTL